MISFLLLQWNYAMYILLTILLFEGATNWRIPILTSRLRYADKPFQITDSENEFCRINFEAERFLRLAVSFFIILGFITFPDELWFLTWFVGLNLLVAGTTGICPMLMLFRRVGLR
jgi:Inner membrane protein YgaP-like, transmembrane domain